MPIYRVNLVDKYGSVQEEQEIDCENDGEAVERAREVGHSHETHVWLGDRLIARFPPKSDSESGRR